MYFGYYSSMIVLIPAIIFTFYCQAKINNAFRTYSNVRNSKGLTGAQAAARMMQANGIDVPINLINRGNALNNYYDPRKKTLNLSQEVANSASVASICIACHEVGHAIQDATSYAPLKTRNAIVPVVNLTQTLSWPLIILGMVLSFSYDTSNTFFFLGVMCFIVVVLFHLITLPVEFNASDRALNQLQELDMVDDADYIGCKKVLKAAAMTYVAALATAIANLLRILLIVGAGRRD